MERNGAESKMTGRLGLAAAVVVVLVHFSSFDVYDQPIVSDVRYFLYYAWQLTEGAIPHLDFFENKPQLSVLSSSGMFWLAEGVGIDPLVAIRVGQLSLAAGAALLAYTVFRRLGGVASGLVGLAAAVGFGLLGALPAVGTLPKLLMALLAPTTALLVHDRRWLWAGVSGGLAFFDWQLGAAAWLAAAVAALVDGPRRAAAFRAVCLGGALSAAPFALWYASRGALGAAFDQVIVATFFRGANSLATRSPAQRAERLAELVGQACPEHTGLLVASALGLPVALWLLTAGRRREGGAERARLLLPLCIFHGFVLAMSALEVQGYGDLFALLHTAAFGLGLAGWALLRGVTARVGPRVGPLPVSLLLALLALVVARPGPLRPAIELASPEVEPGATLSDQREVARRVAEEIGEARFAVLDSSELLFLMRRRNVLPNLYWNRATRAYFRSPADATPTDTVLRLLDTAAVDFFVPPRHIADRERILRGTRPVEVRSRNGRYAVQLRSRAR